MNDGIPAFEVTAWFVAHRRYGRLVSVDTEREEYRICSQSLSLLKADSWRSPEFDPGLPHVFRKLSEEWILSFAAALDRTSVSLAEHPHLLAMGGTRYGLRVSRALQEIEIQWEPRFEDTTENVRELWRMLDEAAGSEVADRA
jgi:hypothetical protein